MLSLLSTPVPRPSNVITKEVKLQLSGLDNYIEYLMKSNGNELQLNIAQEPEVISVDPSVDAGSAMLSKAAMSPHHDPIESQSSSQIPPTYMQLNYNEILDRFFKSEPFTLKKEDAINMNDEMWEQGFNTSPSPTPQSHESSGGSNSPGNISSGSYVYTDSTTNTSNSKTGTSSGDGPQQQQQDRLTEGLINKHNENMEKTYVQKLKKPKSVGRLGDNPTTIPKQCVDEHVHGVKRSGSQSWDNPHYKTAKYLHILEPMQSANDENNLNTTSTQTKPHFQQQIIPQGHIALWPSYSVRPTNAQSTQTMSTPQFAAPTSLYSPVCYIPVTRPNNEPHQRLPAPQPSYYMSLMYPPPLFGSHVLYTQPQIIYRPMTTATPTMSASQTNQTAAGQHEKV